MRRKGGDGWAYQGFNYPKSVWGGQLKATDPQTGGRGARPSSTTSIGGTNTPAPQALAEPAGTRAAARAGTGVLVGEVDDDDARPATGTVQRRR